MRLAEITVGLKGGAACPRSLDRSQAQALQGLSQALDNSVQIGACPGMNLDPHALSIFIEHGHHGLALIENLPRCQPSPQSRRSRPPKASRGLRASGRAPFPASTCAAFSLTMPPAARDARVSAAGVETACASE